MIELKCGTIELKRLARWRCTFRWRRAALQRDQVVPELNDAPPNQNRRNKKKDRRRDERGTVIVFPNLFPNPVHGYLIKACCPADDWVAHASRVLVALSRRDKLFLRSSSSCFQSHR